MRCPNIVNHLSKSFASERSVSKNLNALAGSELVVNRNNVYITAGDQIVCHSLYTGEQLWQRKFDNVFFISNFIVVGDKIIANNEDTYLYALESQTGNQIWEEKSSGTSSPMAYLNGVVYFVGGGDGLLHAVEAETGKHLWRLRSPDLEVNRGAWFKREITVLPPRMKEKGAK